MKEIFTDLYKKVLGFFQTQEKESSESKNVAVNRMKLVLMQDRTNLTPFLLEKMRGEMIAVLAKYVEMDQEALELNFEQEGEQMALMLSIPVVRAKDEDEIKALLEAEEKAKAEADAEVAEEETEEGSEESEQESEDEEEALEEEVQAEEDVCGCGCEDGEECSCEGGCDCECDDDAEEEVVDEPKESSSKKKNK